MIRKYLLFINLLLTLFPYTAKAEVSLYNPKADVDLYYIKKGENLGVELNKSYIPASIIKIFTAAHSLFTFGGNYQFETKIYITSNNEIVIEGSGDPSLTSEVLSECVKNFVSQNSYVRKYDRVILDNSRFSRAVDIPGQGKSDNPYDAAVSAIGINYNSISLKVKGKIVESGEPQTPLTSYAKSLSSGLKNGSHRISIKSASAAERQFVEVFLAMLSKEGVEVKNGYLVKPIPSNSKLAYICKSQPIEQVIRAMLKYSNNYTANQLFLNSGANYFGYPADLDKSRKAMTKFVKEELGVRGDFIIDEGAGLSRTNSLTPGQIMVLLKYFEPYRNLLPESQGVYYKSGTLTGASNLAGYLTDGDRVLGYFALYGKAFLPIEQRVSIVSNLK